MSLFEAMYVVNEDKIIGCEVGTFVWWHERFHQKLEQNYKFYTLVKPTLANMLVPLSFVILALSFLAPSRAYLLWFVILAWTVYSGVDELAAWLYAVKNWGGDCELELKH